jgi:hypothetical protein
MTLRSSNRRQSPPATAVPPERRNGHAQALSPGASAHSGRLQKWHAKPSTADYTSSDQPLARRSSPETAAAPYAGRCHLGESNHFLLLLL